MSGHAAAHSPRSRLVDTLKIQLAAYLTIRTEMKLPFECKYEWSCRYAFASIPAERNSQKTARCSLYYDREEQHGWLSRMRNWQRTENATLQNAKLKSMQNCKIEDRGRVAAHLSRSRLVHILKRQSPLATWCTIIEIDRKAVFWRRTYKQSRAAADLPLFWLVKILKRQIAADFAMGKKCSDDVWECYLLSDWAAAHRT